MANRYRAIAAIELTDHAADGIVDRENAAIDLPFVERTQHPFGGVQIHDLEGNLRRPAGVVPGGILVEAASPALNANHNAVGDDAVGEQQVEHRVLRLRHAQAHPLGVGVEGLQIDEQLPRIVAHLGRDVVQPSGAERVNRCLRKAEALESPADEMGDALTLRREPIVLVCGHRDDDEALGCEVRPPGIKCIRWHPIAIDDDRLALQPAGRNAVRPEERMGEQRLVCGREMPIKHVAGVQFHRQHVDERPGASQLLEERQVLLERALERRYRDAVEDGVGGEGFAQRRRCQTLTLRHGPLAGIGVVRAEREIALKHRCPEASKPAEAHDAGCRRQGAGHHRG